MNILLKIVSLVLILVMMNVTASAQLEHDTNLWEYEEYIEKVRADSAWFEAQYETQFEPTIVPLFIEKSYLEYPYNVNPSQFSATFSCREIVHLMFDEVYPDSGSTIKIRADFLPSRNHDSGSLSISILGEDLKTAEFIETPITIEKEFTKGNLTSLFAIAKVKRKRLFRVKANFASDNCYSSITYGIRVSGTPSRRIVYLEDTLGYLDELIVHYESGELTDKEFGKKLFHVTVSNWMGMPPSDPQTLEEDLIKQIFERKNSYLQILKDKRKGNSSHNRKTGDLREHLHK